MNLQIGERVTYYPPQNVDDNLHWPAEILAIGKRVRVKVTTDTGELVRSVSAKRLVRQESLLETC